MKLINTRLYKHTSSDHDAVICTYKIAGHLFRAGTWNVGDGPDRKKRNDLEALTYHCDVMALQEVGDRNLDELLPPGWSARTNSRTALAWAPGVEPRARVLDRLLSKAQYAGPGAGPSRVGTKHLVGGRWRIGGQSISVGCVHLVASQWQPLRLALAIRQVLQIVAWVKARKSHVLVLGDFNATPGSPTLLPLRRIGMRRAKTGPTHGKRTIDMQWYKSR